MKKCMIAAGLALAAATVASADVTFDYNGPYVFGLGGAASETKLNTTLVSGTLTGVTVTFDWSAAAPGSWVADFLLGIGGVSWGGFGGYTGGWAGQGGWAGFPNTGANGTYTGKGVITAGPAPVFNSEIVSLHLQNGWLNNGGFTLANIHITLQGVDKIPAPGALALLGLAGFASRRRRA